MTYCNTCGIKSVCTILNKRLEFTYADIIISGYVRLKIDLGK